MAGLIILCNAGDSHTGYRGGLTYASTSIEFGADFYTSSAQYTGLAANAVVDLYKLVSIAIGLFFMFVGVIDICVTILQTNITELIGKKPSQIASNICENTEENAEEEPLDDSIIL